MIPLRYQRKFLSITMCTQWIHQCQSKGNILLKWALGNAFVTREVHGQDLVNLVLYRMVGPKAYIDEVHAYVHNRNPVNTRNSQSQIYRTELQLGLVRKAASSTSNLAYSPANLFKRHEVWNQEFPDSIARRLREILLTLTRVGIGSTLKTAALGR